MIRPGFDFVRSEPSLLSVGSFGWIQIVKSVIAGLLVIAGAAGILRVLGAAAVSQRGTSFQFFSNLVFILEWIWVSLVSKQLMTASLIPRVMS
jgi:hypothetical protein